MKKVSLLALSGIVTLTLLGCDGGVAHSLKEVCDNPKKTIWKSRSRCIL